MRRQVYAANPLEAIWFIQEEERGFGLGEFTIKPEERREMKSVYVPKSERVGVAK